MNKKKTNGRKATPEKKTEDAEGLRNKQQKARQALPRWLAPRPFFGLAVAASETAGSGGSTGVKVTMPAEMDLGIDKQGYRLESQQAPTPLNNRFSWTHGAPVLPRTGQTLPHDMKDEAGNPIPKDQPWPNYWTMVVKVTPADQADQITFDLAGDEPGCISYWLGPGVPEKGEIWVQVRALKPTTSIEKNGKRVRRPTGALIVASYKGVPAAQANFYVIRPALLDRSPQPIKDASVTPITSTRHAPYEGPGVKPDLPQHMAPPAQFFTTNFYYHWIEMKVLDQYEKPLADIYSGTTVAEDRTWIAWSRGGTYLDPVGNVKATSKLVYDKNGVAVGRDFYELDPNAKLPWIRSIAHVLSVAGWSLNNGLPINRLLEIRGGKPPAKYPGPMPKKLGYTLSWEE